jgi:hypothetical protein
VLKAEQNRVFERRVEYALSYFLSAFSFGEHRKAIKE